MAMKFETRKTTILGAAEEALSVAEELRDELQEWYDNMPEGLQGGQKGDELQEAIDNLENAISELEDVQNADCTDLLNHEFEYQQTVFSKSTYMSRAKRLQVAMCAANNVPTDLDGLEGIEEDEQDDAQEVLDHVQEAIGYLDSVEFPSR